MRTYKLQHKFSNYFGNYNSSSKSGMSSIHACPVFNLPSPLHISIIFHQVPDISRKMPKDSKGLENHLFNLLPTSQNQSKSPKIATLGDTQPSPAIPSHRQPPQQQIVGWPAPDRPDLHAPRGPRPRAPVPSYCRDAPPRAPDAICWCCDGVLMRFKGLVWRKNEKNENPYTCTIYPFRLGGRCRTRLLGSIKWWDFENLCEMDRFLGIWALTKSIYRVLAPTIGSKIPHHFVR